MRPKIFISKIIPVEVEKYISQHCEYEKWESEVPISRDSLLNKLESVEGLLTSGEKINEELLLSAPRLKIVSNMSVGYNNFDIVAMKERGVLGTHTPGILDGSVADLTFGLILSAARRIPEMDQQIREGGWKQGDDRKNFGLDVHGTKLGIIGMGRIGREVARRGKYGFNMDVLYHNRNRDTECEQTLGARFCSLNELLQESDVIVLLIPLTGETVNFIGENEFKQMKSTAIFINVSRGQTVDEDALIHTLASGGIYAAGLDVFHEEPLTSSGLTKLKNVVMTPHIGTATLKMRSDMAMLAAQNLVLALSGEKQNVVKEMHSESAIK
ncbi:2-hydroxyacid dehydrogenase [Paenisporosarcina indica]|uniref:2-hydroxyacid dehydrogenase n=1 Tax=Paenisporosarcina indica TaxID=650093 RepID=UPI00094F9A3B|nr:D-glycerate dehydrogenase [Paenisporosarcina indica]